MSSNRQIKIPPSSFSPRGIHLPFRNASTSKPRNRHCFTKLATQASLEKTRKTKPTKELSYTNHEKKFQKQYTLLTERSAIGWGLGKTRTEGRTNNDYHFSLDNKTKKFIVLRKKGAHSMRTSMSEQEASKGGFMMVKKEIIRPLHSMTLDLQNWVIKKQEEELKREWPGANIIRFSKNKGKTKKEISASQQQYGPWRQEKDQKMTDNFEDFIFNA